MRKYIGVVVVVCGLAAFGLYQAAVTTTENVSRTASATGVSYSFSAMTAQSDAISGTHEYHTLWVNFTGETPGTVTLSANSAVIWSQDMERPRRAVLRCCLLPGKLRLCGAGAVA